MRKEFDLQRLPMRCRCRTRCRGCPGPWCSWRPPAPCPPGCPRGWGSTRSPALPRSPPAGSSAQSGHLVSAAPQILPSPPKHARRMEHGCTEQCEKTSRKHRFVLCDCTMYLVADRINGRIHNISLVQDLKYGRYTYIKETNKKDEKRAFRQGCCGSGPFSAGSGSSKSEF